MSRVPHRSALALGATFLLLAASARAAVIQTVLVSNPGNVADVRYVPAGVGAVAYNYRIATTEVSNAQYVEFLNGVDPGGANALGLYNLSQTTDSRGGIVFNNAAAPGVKYEIKPGRNNNPAIYISWYDAIRFTNWLHNGQGHGDTENGAYTLIGGGPVPNNGATITRNPGAAWWLPSQDEWYKAAYHKNDGATDHYWDYPTGTNTVPFSDQPPGSDAPNPSNTANFFKNDNVANGYDDGYAVTGSPTSSGLQNYLTDGGAYASARSPYGTFDQGGNVWEWNETLFGSLRGDRGGSWAMTATSMHATNTGFTQPSFKNADFGFRVATAIPEPGATSLLTSASAVLLARRRRPIPSRRQPV
jgi:formylglycine-generating enzyme required for sulfatase activity